MSPVQHEITPAIVPMILPPARFIVIEPLEDRIAPATLTWDGSGGDASWFNPQNWDGNAVPGANDTAILGISSTITLLTDVTVGSFQLSLGTLTGSGSLTIIRDLLWSGGTMSGTGITSAAGSGSIVSGTTAKILDRTLTNSGTLNVTIPDAGGNFTFGNAVGQPGHLVNTTSGTVNVTAGGDFNPSADQNSSIDNAGSWNFSGPTGTISTVGATVGFNNTGSLNVTSGRVEPRGGGIYTGNLAIAGVATLDFSGDTHNFGAGSTISGPGTLEVSSGIWNFQAGSYNVAATRISGGIANFEAPATTSSLTQSGGTLGGGAVLNVSGNLTWSGGTMNGAGSTIVAGSASTITGTAGKILNRTLTNNGTLNITTADGTGNFSFGTVGGQPGHLVNTASGTVNVTAGGDFNPSTDPSSSIDNAGSWNFSSPTGTISTVGATVAFNNTGSLNVTSGRVEPRGGGTNTGSVVIAGVATLDFSGDTHNFGVGSTISGPGTLEVSSGIWNFQAGSYNVASTRISGGIANFEAPATTSSLTQSGGTLGGGAALNVSGDLTWSGGTMNGAGSTTVGGSASTISGTTGKFLNRALINTGTLGITTPDSSGNLAFGTIGGQPGHLINKPGGTVNVTAGGDFTGSTDPNSSIDNAGSWNFSGPSGSTSTAGSSIAFNNTGNVAVASGTFEPLGGGTNTGSLTIATGATLDFGGDTYNLNAGSAVSGGGGVVVTFGTWNLNAGTYNVGATRITGGIANFEVTATTTSLTMTGGTLGGSALLSVAGDFNWSGGTMSGSGSTNVAGSNSIIMVGSSKTLNRTLVNSGTLSVTAADTSANLFFGTVGGLPGHLVNTSSGTVNVTAGGDFNGSTDPNSSIDNAGSWNVTGPTGSRSTVGSSIAFNNTGAVLLATGTFELLGGGTNTSSVTVGSGATLAFGGGTYNLNAGSAISGAGTVLVSFGMLNLNAGSYNVGATQVAGGTANFEVAATTTSLGLSGWNRRRWG
jgi:hypothetical protein